MSTPSSTGQSGLAGSTASFEELSRLVKDAGLLRHRNGYFATKIVFFVLLYAATVVVFFRIGDSWWNLLVAVFAAFLFTQHDFIAHDAGHRQITRKQRTMDALGYFHGNLLTGVSFGWWVGHHTKHHNFPNHVSLDPDISRRQVIFTPEQRARKTSRLSPFIIRHQSWMFFVLILLEGLRLHLAGFVAIKLGAVKRNVPLELTLTIVHLVAYFTTVFVVLSPARAIAFVLVHKLLYGLYMGLAFAPNHKGLPVRDGDTEEWDWITRQVVTSRNLVSNRLVDMMFGGLNYQIEHHLFPAMPRVNLRQARPLIKEYCLGHGLPYVEVSVFESYRTVSRYLGKISKQTAELSR
jgi:fatty acid desaturase